MPITTTPQTKNAAPAFTALNQHNRRNVKFQGSAAARTRFQSIPEVSVKRQISELNPTVISPAKDSASSLSRTSRVINWLANTRFAILSTSGMLKTLRMFLMTGTPAETVTNQIDTSLNELTGSIHLSTTLHLVSGKLAKLIREKIISPSLYAGINEFLKGEHYSFHKLIDVLLPTIFNNLAKHIHGHANLAAEGEPRPIDLSDILSFLSELIGRHASAIGQAFEAIDKISDPVKKDRKMQRLFAPFVEELLSKALPGGVNELPILIPFVSGKVWKAANIELRKLCVKAYRIFKEPSANDQMHLLLKHKGGESLVSLARLASEKSAELIPTLFYDKLKSEDPDTEPDLAPSKVSLAASVALAQLITNSKEMNKLVENWLSQEFCAIGSTDLAPLQSIWKFIAGYIEPLLIHIFASLTTKPLPEDLLKGRKPDAIGIITIRLFTVCTRFFNKRGEEIRNHISTLKSTHQSITDDQHLLSIFDELAQDIFKLCGLENPKQYPIPGFLQHLLHNEINKHTPKILLKQYLVFTDSSFEDDGLNRKLRSILFDPKNIVDPSIAVNVVHNLHANRDTYAQDMFNKFYDVLWDVSGTDTIAKIVEALSAIFANDAITSFRQFYGIADQNALDEINNPSMAQFDQWLENWAKRAFSEIITHILEMQGGNVSLPDHMHPKTTAPLEIIIALAGIFHKNINGIAEHLEATSRKHTLDSPEYKQEAELAFQRLSQGLHSFVGFNPLSTLKMPDMPAEDEVKNLLWNTIRDGLLPQLLHNFYTETVIWQDQLDESYKKIDDCFHTSHPQWACKVMAQYATDFLKHYLGNSSDEAAMLTLESLKNYAMNSKSPNGGIFDTLISGKEDDVKTLIQHNIKEAPSISDPHFNAVWPALTTYFEAMIAKFFAEFATSVHKIETDNPDFMVDTAIQFLKDAAEHFSIIAGKIKETGDENVFNVDMKELVAAFGDKLHDGIPINTEGTEQEKDMERMKGLFIPLADKFLKLANLTIDDFPLPSPVKKLIGQIAVDKLLPLCLMKAFQKGMEPQVRDSMMFNFVQTLYAALNAMPSQPRVETLPEADVHPNMKQKHLYDTCGNLVLELIKIIPDTTVQYVFMKEKVKNMSAAAIGDAMMPYLSRWTMIQIIDMMIYSGLPSLHPSKWEGKQGREALIPRRAFVRPDGKMELKPVKEFKFEFPTDEGEISARQAAAGEEINRVRTQLRDAFTRTISQQLHAKVWAFTKSLWALFQSTLDDFLVGRFGENGLAIKAKMDVVFRRVFFDVIGNVIAFLSIPLVAAVKFINEKAVIDRRSIDVIRNFESGIMENLIYKWVSSIFDSLLRLKEADERPQLQVDV